MPARARTTAHTDAAPAMPATAARPAPVAPEVGDEELAARLRVAVTRLHRRLRQESLGGVSPAQASALATIDRRGRPTLGELAQAEQVQPPSLTPLITSMEAAGLVVRLGDEKDRRVVRVELTPRGRRALDGIRRLKTAYLTRRLGDLDPDARDRARELTELLESLVVE